MTEKLATLDKLLSNNNTRKACKTTRSGTGNNHNNITISLFQHAQLYIYIDVMDLTEVKHITKSVCIRNQAHKYLQKNPICITDSDHYFTLEEIKRRDTIEYEINMSIDETYEQFR